MDGRYCEALWDCGVPTTSSIRFNIFLRTLKDIKDELRPLGDLITNILIPAIVSFRVSDIDRKLFSLPVRLGGMGIEQISSVAEEEYARSKQITAPFAAIIALRGNCLPTSEDLEKAKSEALKQKSESLKARSSQLDETLPSDVQRNLTQACEHGASSWLSALPLEKHNFSLNKLNSETPSPWDTIKTSTICLRIVFAALNSMSLTQWTAREGASSMQDMTIFGTSKHLYSLRSVMTLNLSLVCNLSQSSFFLLVMPK